MQSLVSSVFSRYFGAAVQQKIPPQDWGKWEKIFNFDKIVDKLS